MISNRSMPHDLVIPVLGYPSVSDAVAWLAAAFGFSVRWQIGEHRAQLGIGPTAAIAVTQSDSAPSVDLDQVMVRVQDVAAHRERAAGHGASCTAIEEFPYGEKQYTATDPAGRRWVFSESVRDVAPEDWGAAPGRS